METLLSIDAFPGDKPLLACDFDGVLNLFPEPAGQFVRNAEPPAGAERRRVRTAHGEKYLIDFYPEIVAELDEIVRSGVAELGWLTTWGPNIRAVIEQAFDGKLSGGFVLKKQPPKFRGFRPADWKLTGLRDRVAVTGQPWVWLDDEVILAEKVTNPGFNESSVGSAPGMFIIPDQAVGITAEDIAAIWQFIETTRAAA
ncbi:HAD domain-containing protein [Agromyces humi]|uniref:HAD domain-containing protein n=1 Tax=Agromyces humi TaxID=1766800 RepID=UPI001358E4D1|nr:HAD domain-containing protein [Agromyces humi]